MHTTALTKLMPSSGDNRFLLGRTASPAMHAVERIVAKVAPTNVPLLLIGESGTGKEVLAQLIHQLSLRANEPLVKVICAFVSSESLPAYFNGHNNGDEHIGTLFLKEIAELDSTSQRNLLYSLPQEDPGAARISVRARLVSSTCRNLEEEVRGGRFRADLYYQISAVSLSVPSLRQRKEDIPEFVELFLAKYSSLLGRSRPHLDSQDFALLQGLPWPGNIRELENVVRKIVLINDSKAVLSQLAAQANEIPISAATGKASPLKTASRAASHRTERQLILETLARTRWNRKRAAQELQISYKSLLYKLKQIRAEEQEAV
jgi:two-component system, NtrC family, response regulator AtoC